jgi:hypothetical protein
MIQFKRNSAPSTTVSNTYVNLYDKLTNTDYKVLVGVTSQLTGKVKYYTPTTNYANKERYVQLLTFIASTIGGENLTSGVVFLGSTDFPLGFYDVTIYQNTSNVNLNPAGLTVVYTGLMNLEGSSSSISSVTYTEYTDNDSETESAYITNATQ